MNILILNWRDIKNPSSGGAEILTHEIAKRWVKWGHQVAQFSSSFPNCLAEEKVDGVKIIRRGHPDARFLFSSAHFLAFKYYKDNVGKFDVVVDEIHGLPFFTPWYVKEEKVVLICEVAGNLWVKMFGPFFGLFGRLTERLYLRFIYKNIPYLTISNSTREELIREGVKSKSITVLPMGLTIPKKIKKVEKEKDPTLIFVGRITKSKGIEDAIMAFKNILTTAAKARLWIIGDGNRKYIDYLKKMARKLDVSDRITFWGFVSQEKKFELMRRAHLLLHTSVKEGWGLVVIEAASQSTPSIVYDVAGLRDSVKDGKTGIVLKENNAKEMANQSVLLLNNKKRYEDFQKNALIWAKSLTWDKAAKQSLKIIEMVGKNKKDL